MKEFKGTKGRWEAKYKIGCDINIRIKQDETIIADGYSFASGIPNEEAEANAKLIAAAPELLDALQGIMFRFADLDYHSEEVINAKSAINKALD